MGILLLEQMCKYGNRYGTGQITNVYDARYWGIGTYSDVSLWIQESIGILLEQ